MRPVSNELGYEIADAYIIPFGQHQIEISRICDEGHFFVVNYMKIKQSE